MYYLHENDNSTPLWSGSTVRDVVNMINSNLYLLSMKVFFILKNKELLFVIDHGEIKINEDALKYKKDEGLLVELPLRIYENVAYEEPISSIPNLNEISSTEQVNPVVGMWNDAGYTTFTTTTSNYYSTTNENITRPEYASRKFRRHDRKE